MNNISDNQIRHELNSKFVVGFGGLMKRSNPHKKGQDIPDPRNNDLFD